jgi:magnesium chelatase subunit D
MAHRNPFPFTAIVGQEAVKRALLIALVNVKAGGVLIAGETGTGKSTIVRALAEIIPDTRMLEIPLNATEDMVFGSLDMEYAVLYGQRRFAPGLLAKANGHTLYMDEVNLLRRDLVNAVLDTAATGVNRVERDGISHRQETMFTVIGTMNPEEGMLPAPVLDKFGLFVMAEREQDAAARVEIVRRRLAYENHPSRFREQYDRENQDLRSRIAQARAMLGQVEIPEGMMRLAAERCAGAGSAGHRAELFLLEAAKAVAALAGREYLLADDIDEAVCFVLPHRSRQEQDEPQTAPERQEQSPERQDSSRQDQPSPSPPQPPEQGDPGQEAAGRDKEQQALLGTDEERTADIDRNFSAVKLRLSSLQDRQVRKGSGKRSLTRTDSKQGRYVRAGIPNGSLTDLAFDATLRAAAPYQQFRGKGTCAVSIRQEDVRQKVREKRIGNTFLFVVDASGSMGARERMRVVKGAIFSMLQDAYQKRDQVGLIAFRRRAAEVLLPVTRSVDLAQKCLRHLPIGGKTPLAEGLATALDVLHSLRRKDKDIQPVLILVTDGRANSSALESSDPLAEAVTAARKVGRTDITSVVIDTETDFVKLGLARTIAGEMGASCYSLRELSGEQMLNIVKNVHRKLQT